MKPVIAPPLLPYPGGRSIGELSQFDADMRRALVEILTQYAFRLNGMLPADGSEPMTGPLNMGGFGITNLPSGTWTPSLQFGGAATGMTYSVRNGVYTKIDKLVFVSAVITLSAKGSSTGTALIQGLPFTSGNNRVGSAAVASYASMAALNFGPVASIGFNVTNIALRQHSAGAAFVALTEANFTDTSTFNVAITYMVD